MAPPPAGNAPPTYVKSVVVARQHARVDESTVRPHECNITRTTRKIHLSQDALCDAVADLALEAVQPAPLRGLPVPTGSHVVFDDEGEAVVEEGTRGKVLLRGVPVPTGRHVRFDQHASSV